MSSRPQAGANVKHATPDHPVHELIAERWSPRAFANIPVEPEKLRSALEALRWSASGGNGQPWFLLIATKNDADAHAAMVSCLMDGNVAWASQAPVLGVMAVSTVRASGAPNRYAWYDAGLAMQNLSVQATALGLHLHQMGGFYEDKAQEVFHIPKNHEAVVMFALGYLGDPGQLNEKQREQEITPRERKPLTDFVFGSQWGEVSDILTD